MFSEHTLKLSCAMRFLCLRNIHAGINIHTTLNLSLPAPCISESCIKIKINLNFNFHTSLWYLKGIYEGLKGLHKTFWGTTKKCENKNLRLRSNKIREIPSLVDFHSLYQLLHSQVYRNELKLWISNVKICLDKWRRIK